MPGTDPLAALPADVAEQIRAAGGDDPNEQSQYAGDQDQNVTQPAPDPAAAAESMRDGGWTAATDFDPPLGIVPTIFASCPIPPMGRIALRASNALGVQVFWLTPPEARTLAQTLKRAAVDVEVGAESRATLAVPPGAGRLIVPGQVQ